MYSVEYSKHILYFVRNTQTLVQSQATCIGKFVPEVVTIKTKYFGHPPIDPLHARHKRQLSMLFMLVGNRFTCKRCVVLMRASLNNAVTLPTSIILIMLSGELGQ